MTKEEREQADKFVRLLTETYGDVLKRLAKE